MQHLILSLLGPKRKNAIRKVTTDRSHTGVIYRRRLLLVVVRMAGAFSVQ